METDPRATIDRLINNGTIGFELRRDGKIKSKAKAAAASTQLLATLLPSPNQATFRSS